MESVPMAEQQLYRGCELINNGIAQALLTLACNTHQDLKATAEAIQSHFSAYGYDTVTADEFWELSDTASNIVSS